MASKRRIVSREDAAIVRMLVDRTARGHSLLQISRTSGISKNRLLNLAQIAGIRYRGRPATPEQIQVAVRAVLEDGDTMRGAAKKAGISKTAAHRYVLREREQTTRIRGGIQFRSARQFDPCKSRRQNRCPRHGVLTVWPCVACAAMQHKSRRKH